MTLSDIKILFHFNSWAKTRTLSVVETLSEEQFTRDLKSSHGGIHGTLVHTMGADETWLKRLQGESPTTFPGVQDVPTLAALKKRWDEIEHGFESFVQTLKTDADLQRIIAYKDLKGNPYSQPVYQIIEHVVNHSSYHRGQVTSMLRQLGVKPMNTDMIVFFREVKSA